MPKLLEFICKQKIYYIKQLSKGGDSRFSIMNVIVGIALLLFLLFNIIRWCQKDGILFFCDFSRAAFIIWTLGLGLYDLALSELYHPSFTINVICCIIILNFYAMTFLIPFRRKVVLETYTNIALPNKQYKYAVIFSLCLGILSFIVNFMNDRLRFFMSNAGEEVEISLSYFLNLMVAVSLFFYILTRISKSWGKRIAYFILCIFSLFLIFCNMARGPLVFWATGVILFEVTRFVHKTGMARGKFKYWLILIVLLLLGVVAFGLIGDFRTETIFADGATEFYKMPPGTPSGLTWVYIYLTSPLENARVMLEGQTVTSMACFNNLFYPFVKFIANLFGKDTEYVAYLTSISTVYPTLKAEYGLNVSSFIADAYSDFSYFGIAVYLIFYDAIAFFIQKMLRSRRISNLSKAVIFPIVLQVAFWSIFSNSVFRITSIWFDVVFVVIWELFGKLFAKNKKSIGREIQYRKNVYE